MAMALADPPAPSSPLRSQVSSMVAAGSRRRSGGGGGGIVELRRGAARARDNGGGGSCFGPRFGEDARQGRTPSSPSQAKLLTNIRNPIQAGQELLRRGTCTKWVVIKMGSKESIMITESAVSCAPYFKIRVVDTVGCRDSFTAARAFGLLHNFPAINTLALANAVGAATTTGCGVGRNATHLDKVLNLLKESDFNEEGKTWTELVEGCSICPEVSVPSKTPINGSSDLFVNVVPVSGVVSDLLLMLEV